MAVYGPPRYSNASICVSSGFDPSLQRDYADHYHSINVHVAKYPAKLVPGAIALSHEYVEDGELLKTEYYDGFLRPLGVFYLMGALVALQPGALLNIAFYRSRPSGPFSEEAAQMLRLVLPHFARAARLQSTLRGFQAGWESLDSLAVGVIVVHAAGRIFERNSYARQVLDCNDSLASVGGCLTAANPRERAKLADAIRQASASAAGNGLAAGRGALTVNRPSGRRPYVLFVSPLRSPALFWGKDTAGAVVFLTDPERQPELDPALVAHVHGLTPSQARLACALARGIDLDQYAAEASIGRNTARTHLRLLFEKLGVKRQGELVALLARSLGPVELARTGPE